MMATGIYTYMFAVLVYSFQQDVQPKTYYCSNNPKPWKEAMLECLVANGKPVSFVKDQDKVDIIKGLHIWTGDYAQQTSTGTDVCAFVYLNNTHYLNSQRNILYGDCDAFRFFFCRQGGTWVVLKNARSVSCEDKIRDKDLTEYSYIISPGYYWAKEILTIEEHVVDARNDLKSSEVLCGAYETNVGRYYTRCDKVLSSLCNLTDETVSSDLNVTTQETGSDSENKNGQGKFNKDCLSNYNSLTGHLTKGDDTQITTLPTAGNKEIGMFAGISTGIGLAVVFGVIVTIFILRRHKILRYKMHSEKTLSDTTQSRDNHGYDTEEYVTNRTESNQDAEIYTEASSEEVSKVDVVTTSRHDEGFATSELNKTYNYCYAEEIRNEHENNTTRTFDMNDSSIRVYDKLKQQTQYFELNDFSTNKRTDNFYGTVQDNVEYNTTSNSNRRNVYVDTYDKLEDQEEYNVIGNISTPRTTDNVYGKMIDDEEYDKTGNVRKNKPSDNIYNKISVEHDNNK